MMYIFTIAIFLCALFLKYISGQKTYRLIIGKKLYRFTEDEILFFLLLVFLFLFWSLKAISVGGDTFMYKYMYGVADGYIKEGLVWQWNNQPLYYWIFATLEKSGISFRTAQVIFYFFACVGIYILLKNYSHNKVLALFFFVTCESMALYASALRQMLAITFGIFAIHFIMQKKVWRALFAVVCAILLHKSACVLLILFALYFYIPSKKQLLIFAPCIWSIALLLPVGLIRSVAVVFGYGEYMNNIGTSSDPLLIAMYLCMGVLVWYMIYQTKWDTLELRYFTVLFVISIAIMLFSSKFYLLSRLQYYFQVPQYLVFAEAVDKLANKKSALLFGMVIVLYIVFFVFTLNSDTLSINPYDFFWNAGERWS